MELVAEAHPVIAWTLGICAALVLVAGAWKAVIKPGIAMLRQWTRFLDDWYGRENPDGTREPGVRARLDNMEAKVEQVHHQTHPNGGESLKDIATRTETNVNGLTHRMDIHLLEARALDTHLASHDARFETLEKWIGMHDENHHPPREDQP